MKMLERVGVERKLTANIDDSGKGGDQAKWKLDLGQCWGSNKWDLKSLKKDQHLGNAINL